MWFVILGVALVALKLADFGSVAAWSWWAVLSPFAAAFAWWTFADASGLTKRREVRKMEERKAERRRRNLENLGLDPERIMPRGRQAAAAQRRADRIEAQRSQQRLDNEQVVRNSRFDGAPSVADVEAGADTAAARPGR